MQVFSRLLMEDYFRFDTYSVYKESQKFRQPLIWVVLLFVLMVVMYSFFVKLSSAGFNQLSFEDILPLLITASVLLFLFVLRLDISIDQNGIGYKWNPVMQNYKVIAWRDIESVKVRPYHALMDYGGYGIRYTFKSTAYVVSGQWGIELRIKGRKRKFFLGITREEEARRAIQRFYDNVMY